MIERLRGEFAERLLDSLQELVWLREPSGEVLFVNAAVETVLGVPAADYYADGRSHLRHVRSAHRERLMAAGRAAVEGTIEVEFEVEPPGREPGWVHARVSPLHDGAGRVVAVIGVARDVTEAKRSEELRREVVRAEVERDDARSGRAQLRAMLDRITDGFFALDREWRILYTNRRFEEMLGRDATKLLGRAMFEVFPDFHGNVFHRHYERALRDNEPVEFEAYSETGSAWYEVRGYPSEEGISVFFQDVTEKRRLELELVEAAARERQRVGAELHDSVGQKLTGATLLVRAMEARAAAGEAVAAEELGAIGAVLGDLVAETRRISRGLFPAALDGDSLAGALENLAAEVDELFDVSCSARVAGAVPLPREAEAHLLRIAQELITNAVKHGEAGTVVVSLERTDGVVELAVEHDGAPPAADHGQYPGVGLRSLEYRAHAIGGVLETVGTADAGTRSTCRVPL